MGNKLSVPSKASARTWVDLVWHRWIDSSRNRIVTRVLGVVTAVLAIATAVWHLPWAPTVVSGALTISWAIVSAPIAAYETWRDERAARIAADEALAVQPPTTLRAATFELAREMRTWLKAIPSGLAPNQAAALWAEFDGRFHARGCRKLGRVWMSRGSQTADADRPLS